MYCLEFLQPLQDYPWKSTQKGQCQLFEFVSRRLVRIQFYEYIYIYIYVYMYICIFVIHIMHIYICILYTLCIYIYIYTYRVQHIQRISVFTYEYSLYTYAARTSSSYTAYEVLTASCGWVAGKTYTNTQLYIYIYIYIYVYTYTIFRHGFEVCPDTPRGTILPWFER